MASTKDIYKKRIRAQLGTLKKNRSISYKRLYKICKGRKQDPEAFAEAVDELKSDGIVFEKHDGLSLYETCGAFRARVLRLNRTFGFIENEEGTEIFVPGKLLLGAMPNDIVMAVPIESKGEEPEAKVISILKEENSEFVGTVKKTDGGLCLYPNNISKAPLEISESDIPIHDGDKVSAVVSQRGKKHSAHKIRITNMFGDSSRASTSAEAILYINGVETEFPQSVTEEAKQAENTGIPAGEPAKRLDLRDEIIFTIDGADTKDIDDAVSVSKTEQGWELGVHIADVSYYVRAGSELDKDAMLRGTSIYYADKVIPMLPKELSNGICSLNPDEDRLAFSCLMNIDAEGHLVSYKFSKTIIRSRVKGVYSEINQILDCIKSGAELPQELAEKYDGLIEKLLLMDELAAILNANKLRRGAPQIDSPECKIIIGENGICTDVKRKERGKSEIIIEEFMLMANTSAARLAKEKGIPFVYRVHEDPSPERIQDLAETVSQMGIAVPDLSEVKPKQLAEILEKTADSPFSPMINKMVLRSMAKAKYSDEPLGHFGLVLEDYSHFTSPIRRYPDLAIHRILTSLCYDKASKEHIIKRYAGFASEAAKTSSECELRAMLVERDCEDCYIAEYMSAHLGEEFEGIISSVHDYGFFVELPNTIEGLVRIESLENGPYDFDGRFTFMKFGKPVYRIGDKVRVICAAADVSTGQVDFTIAENS